MTEPVRQTEIILTYPFGSPTHTVTLRPPDFGNIERLGFTRILRKTRGGAIKSFYDEDWPKEDILTFNITGISQDEKDDLVLFLAASLGKEIGLVDHEGFTWLGIILNPNAPITCLRKVCFQDDGSHEEEYGWGFEFQGELQEEE
jgi:hypothetical protein